MSTISATSLATGKSTFLARLINANKTFTPSLLPSGSGLTGEAAQAGRNQFAENRKSTRRELSNAMAPYANTPKRHRKLQKLSRGLAGQKSAEYEL